MREVITSNRNSTAVINELVLLPSLPVNLAGSNSSAVHTRTRGGQKKIGRSRGAKPLRGQWNQSRTIASYICTFGRLLVRHTIQASNFDDNGHILSGAPYKRKETTWIFVPSFLSTCINYQYVNACGFIQRSIRIYPFLSQDHPVWDRCINGDLEGLQRFLGEGQISPFSINSWGDTLLHVRHYVSICTR